MNHQHSSGYKVYQKGQPTFNKPNPMNVYVPSTRPQVYNQHPRISQPKTRPLQNPVYRNNQIITPNFQSRVSNRESQKKPSNRGFYTQRTPHVSQRPSNAKSNLNGSMEFSKGNSSRDCNFQEIILSRGPTPCRKPSTPRTSETRYPKT